MVHQPTLRALVIGVALTIVIASCRSRPDPPPSPDATPPTPASAAADVPADAPVQIEMKNVRLHAADGLILAVQYLRGEMVSTVNGQPPVFDDQRSYVLHVSSAELAMDMASLTSLMNDHVFAYKGAPLTNLSVTADQGRLAMKGTLHKGVPLPFSSVATIEAAPGGRLRLHTEKVSALGLPTTKLLQIFDLKLEDLVALEGRRGISLTGDDIILTPGQVLPPPEIRGNIAQARLANGQLLLTFSPASGPPATPLTPAEPAAQGYVFFSGSSIRFGKLTMRGSDLQLIDADASDPFDFFPARYQRQLVAGYSKNTVQGGLKTYMPDYDDIGRMHDMKPSGVQ